MLYFLAAAAFSSAVLGYGPGRLSLEEPEAALAPRIIAEIEEDFPLVRAGVRRPALNAAKKKICHYKIYRLLECFQTQLRSFKRLVFRLKETLQKNWFHIVFSQNKL